MTLATAACPGCGTPLQLIIDRAKGWTSENRSKSPLYDVWRGMLRRCHDPKKDNYRNYGGRGIRVCEQWFDFGQFASDVGPRPRGCTLDRIDNNGNYEPNNVRWATQSEQHRNLHRESPLLTVNGVTKPLDDWQATSGLSRSTLWRRFKKGLPPEEIVKPKSPTWNEQCRVAGISVGTFEHRVRQGMSPEEALTRPRQQGRRLM